MSEKESLDCELVDYRSVLRLPFPIWGITNCKKITIIVGKKKVMLMKGMKAGILGMGTYNKNGEYSVELANFAEYVRRKGILVPRAKYVTILFDKHKVKRKIDLNIGQISENYITNLMPVTVDEKLAKLYENRTPIPEPKKESFLEKIKRWMGI